MTTWTVTPSLAHLERNILMGMIITDRFLAVIKDHYYEPRLLAADFGRDVARWCLEYFKEYGRAPGRDIQTIFESERPSLNPDSAQLIEHLLGSLSAEYERAEDYNVDFELDVAIKYFKGRAQELLKEDIEFYQEGGNQKSIDEAILKYQAKDLARQTYEDHVYIAGNPETAEAVKGLIAEGKIAPGTVLGAAPALGRLAGKHVTLVNGDIETFEKLKEPFNLGSLRPVSFKLDKGDEYVDYIVPSFILNPDFARRDLKQQLPDFIRMGYDFSEQDFPEISRLCGPVETQSINLFYGAPGVGKSFLAMEIAGAVAAGRPAMAGLWETPGKANVLFVDGEMLPKAIQDRIEMLGMGNCRVLSKAELEANNVVPAMNLADEEVRKGLEEQIMLGQFKLVILDNIFSLVTGIDPNSSRDWEPINLWLLRLRAKGVSTILIHHTGKSGDQMGTAAKLFNVNLALALREAEDREENTCSFTVKVAKQRGRYQGLTRKAYTCESGKWTVAEDTNAEKEERDLQVLGMLAEGKKYDGISKAIGVSPATVTKIKNGLVKAGWLIQKGEGRRGCLF
jgi:hypothetical protein